MLFCRQNNRIIRHLLSEIQRTYTVLGQDFGKLLCACWYRLVVSLRKNIYHSHLITTIKKNQMNNEIIIVVMLAVQKVITKLLYYHFPQLSSRRDDLQPKCLAHWKSPHHLFHKTRCIFASLVLIHRTSSLSFHRR